MAVCKEHKRYRAIYKPRLACEGCWRLWFDKERSRDWQRWAKEELARWAKEDAERREFEKG